jgi:dihydrofolate synthase / folylpolyglutamate synthase
VCATLEALLRARGLRVGKYTSPHLVDLRERFLVDGRPVSEEFVVDFIRRWTPEVERLGATFFEATTAMAFAWFVEAAVDVAVIETGLGGRLDSTNVVRPEVAGVTSIAIDHVEYLGDTREQIAYEKAGIFKAGVPAAIGERDEGIIQLLTAHARQRAASPVRAVWHDAPPRDVAVDQHGTTFTMALDGETCHLHTPLAGVHQASNAALAALMCSMAGRDYYSGLAPLNAALSHVRLPGRFQREGRFIFDVAHNPDGACVLAATLAAAGVTRPLAAVLTVLSDKDWRGVMRALAPVVDAFVLTDAPSAPVSRSWNVSDAKSWADANGWSALVEIDFDRAIETATRIGATVLITGSFHTVGDAMSRLQVDPLGG